MSADAATPTLTRAQRLDRLPFTREHGRLVVGSGVGWALDAMDVGLISFVMAALAVQWSLTPTELSWIGSIGFVGMALGATLGGLLADRVGRRQVFALTLLVFGVATGAAALSWSVASLLVFRLLIGLGLGAELPVASTLVSEYAPARLRGRVVVALEAFWAVGWLLAALIGYLVVPRGDAGWRWALALGAVPALYAVVVRRGLPESVRFLELRGRDGEAEAAVRRFEAAAGVAPQPSGTHPQTPAARRGGLWAPDTRGRTAALWTVWFGINFAYYGAFIWLPTLLVAAGFDLVRSFGYTLLITLAQLPGYAAAAVLVERWGRRPTLVVFLAGSAVGAALFALAVGDGAVLVTGMVLSFSTLGAWGAVYAVTPEVYPTALRGTGAGAAAGFGRIASIAAPLCVPPLLAAGGSGLVFGVFAAAFVVAAAGSWALPERRGEALDPA
ncbi:MFS transporter, putative metabolite:H+ symporter [Geodermatophilus dictyosporus]|uniref:MFS transporter, putative metabolite:H+ symporter n=1 Tax=Geodermatophilus dictyosporus TaxID=1523247 RepID=A0A1I5RLC1_9ACTN|nr:MFS transporter [Geodermatophilus dictyosporus]SFP59339.1 MFS transporter, putative metabolite:H+ symporter [Geodermatophilus dictyosporus]